MKSSERAAIFSFPAISAFYRVCVEMLTKLPGLTLTKIGPSGMGFRASLAVLFFRV
jgi:hypothetical protein